MKSNLKDGDGNVEVLFKVNNRDKMDVETLSQNSDLKIETEDINNGLDMNVNLANVRKPGKKLIDHKNKQSSFQGLTSSNITSDFSDMGLNLNTNESNGDEGISNKAS